MKTKLALLVAALAVVVGLAVVTAPRAQGVVPTPWQEARLLPGEEVLLHLSYDSAIDIVVERPFTVTEQLMLTDLTTGKKYPMPNSSAVRAQGHLLISRAPDPDNAAKTLVRWKHVDTMFSYSRDLITRKPRL